MVTHSTARGKRISTLFDPLLRFCPSVFLYLASVCPSIWLIELDRLDSRLEKKNALERLQQGHSQSGGNVTMATTVDPSSLMTATTVTELGFGVNETAGNATKSKVDMSVVNDLGVAAALVIFPSGPSSFL